MKTTVFACASVLAIVSLPAAAADEKLTSHLSEDGKTLAYTPCGEEEWGECISHSLNCRGDSGFGDGLQLIVSGAETPPGPDVRSLGKQLIDKPLGGATV